MRLLAATLALLALVPLGALVTPDDAAPAARATPAPSAPRTRGAVTLAAPARSPSLDAPSGAALDLPPSVDDLLDALDDDPDHPLTDGDLARLEAAWLDGDLDLPLRAGALRALLERGGRGALARVVDAFDREEVAPLREHVAHAASRGAGPGDAPLLARLLDRAAGADAAALAALAAVHAARRPDDPVPLGPALEARVVETLAALPAEHAADVAEALAALRTPAAVDALALRAEAGADDEGRLEAGLALHALDPTRAAPALARLRAALTCPLLRDRLPPEAPCD
ncbi:MAG: hypothetical protein M9894_05570 [Planctomycetes bacterium]|nr:hypothetical protein [Planctomycetota bacterium]